MEEFREAHAHATGNGRKRFLIPILREDINIRDLDADLKLYLENHTYIECKSLVNVYLFNLKKSEQNPEGNVSNEKN